MIRLVCFDLGGVVVRICRSWAEGCAAAGVPVRDPGMWESTRSARRALIVQYQTGRIDGLTFAERASAAVGQLYSPAEFMGVHRAWLRGEYDGMAELVDRLHGGGLDTAALSNTNHEHWIRMGDFPAVMRIRHLLASHRLGLHKPDRLIYRRLERITGYSGGEIVFFDDGGDNVEAAREIGWEAEVVDPSGSPAEQVAEALQARGVAV